jgi:hypothetical protein
METEKTNIGKYIFRILISPIMFLWGCIILIACTVIPVIPFIVGLSIIGMISTPFIWLFKMVDSDLNYMEPFICDYRDFLKDKNIFRDHFISSTIYIWGPFWVAYHWIECGKVFKFDDY